MSDGERKCTCKLYCIMCGDLPDGTSTNPQTVALEAGDVVRVIRNPVDGQWRLEIDRPTPGVLDNIAMTVGAS
jgi:hypothetical protein